MKMLVTDRLSAPTRGTPMDVMRSIQATPESRADVWRYLQNVWACCELIGLDASILAAQSYHECFNPDTGVPWGSHYWQAERNPAGIGIFDDGSTNRIIYKDEADAARAQVAHMCAYVGSLPPTSWIALDPRYRAAQAEYGGSVKVLGDLGGGRWATDTNYAPQIAAAGTKLFASVREEPTVAELRVILNPGHRNTTGGNPEEAAFTPKLADAYFDAFSAAGYETVNLGDTNGGLDEACRRMAVQIASAPGPCVLFDLHLEGEGASGVFAIVPDITGLHTNAAVPQDPADTWENNAKDRELAKQISRQIMGATGLTLRQGIREPGIMDESETGVGGDGFRLATFAYTSPYREKAVRLVVEHGCHTLEPDRSIIFSPGFAEKCAKAAVAAVKIVYGETPVPTPEKPVPSVPWGRDAVGPQKINDRPALAFLGEVTAKRDVPIRVTATATGEVFARMKKGDRAVIRGSYRAENGTRWAFVEINGGVGRALLSAFTGPWPTL